jgi:hypothetical protein
MIANGESILVAVSLHFMVEPSHRCGLVGVQLLRELFRGPQDLTISDGANHDGRKLWEAMGGHTSQLHSLYWTRILRPGSYVMSQVAKHWPGSELMGKVGDAIANRIARRQFSIVPQSIGEELAVDLVLDQMQDFVEKSYLRPDYDAPQLEWILDRARRRAGNGRFHKVLVRDSDGKILGWYLCYLSPGATCSALQIVATKQSISKVLDHLFHHAWRSGAIAVAGRLDPRFTQELSDKYCFLHRRGPWTLVHSRRPELLHAIQAGDSFLTPLEGEWCWLSPAQQELP